MTMVIAAKTFFYYQLPHLLTMFCLSWSMVLLAPVLLPTLKSVIFAHQIVRNNLTCRMTYKHTYSWGATVKDIL